MNRFRRTLFVAPLAVIAIAAAGCGGSSSSSNADPAQLIKDGNVALKSAHSVGFDVKVSLDLNGQLSSTAAPAAAMLNGPVTVELKGHASKSGDAPSAFDTTFTVDTSGFSVKGEVLSADGKTGYVTIPALLGDGWKSFPIKSSHTAMGGTDAQKLDLNQKLKGVDPATWLKNLVVTSSDGNDTISADLDPAKMVADIIAASNTKPTAADTKQINQLTGAINVAHGSVSYDQSSHLPSAASAEVTVTVPPSLVSKTQGVNGFDFKIDASFDDWNKDVSVTPPSSSEPLNLAKVNMLGAGGL
jgi:hypothetical protein